MINERRETSVPKGSNCVGDRFVIYSQNNDYSPKGPICDNEKIITHPLTPIVKFQQPQFWVVTCETYPRSVQVGSTSSEIRLEHFLGYIQAEDWMNRLRKSTTKLYFIMNFHNLFSLKIQLTWIIFEIFLWCRAFMIFHCHRLGPFGE